MARHKHQAARMRHGFSLAELMVALVILGLGLLFIAAALPVGIEYTRQTVLMADAEAAGEYAVEQLDMALRTSTAVYSNKVYGNTGIAHRTDNLFRPRHVFSPSFPLQPVYEPIIKVRPFALGNIGMEKVQGSDPYRQGAELVDNAEQAIYEYVSQVIGIIPINPRYGETDFQDYGAGTLAESLSPVYSPVLPGIARVYPPISTVTSYRVSSFYDNSDPNYAMYPMRSGTFGTLSPAKQFIERKKAIDRRIAWTGLYRRISYSGDAGPQSGWNDGDETADDPLLYEEIIVVTHRPTTNHRFPRQDFTAASPFIAPAAAAPATTDEYVGTDRLAPIPWLVTFDPNFALPPQPFTAGTEYARLNAGTLTEQRVLLDNFHPPATLTFKCTSAVGDLLPVGSVFIPARNDQRDHPSINITTGTQENIQQYVGYVPSAPKSLPIYEVINRPDENTVVTENNGYYPWLSPTGIALDASSFPVWVIPPSFVERDRNGQPIYEAETPIIKVLRRTIKIPDFSE